MENVIKFLLSDEFKLILLALSGWFITWLITTKTGNTVLSILKHCLYWFKNPAIKYSASFNFYFNDTVAEHELKHILYEIYNSELLTKYELKREGFKETYCKLYYAGISYTVELDKNEIADECNLHIKIKETESNYKNLKGHLQQKVIKGFLKDIVISEIQSKFTTSQYHSNYQINLRFTEPKYNFFVKGRLSKIPKGLIDSVLVSIKDKEKDNWNITADLEKITITVKNDFNEFFESVSKYISII